MPKFGCALMMVWLAICHPGFAAGPLPPSYIVKTAPEGLPQNSVISMIQTRDGYLWLGTTKGLARFDGHHYEVFNEWNTPGLGGNLIVHLFEDSRGGIWVGAGNAVTYIKDGQVTTLEIPGGPGGQLKS
ncbi:MAG: two-component regulator propeller domain-containing protein, partial [Verrucomicrobiota bacterium]